MIAQTGGATAWGVTVSTLSSLFVTGHFLLCVEFLVGFVVRTGYLGQGNGILGIMLMNYTLTVAKFIECPDSELEGTHMDH